MLRLKSIFFSINNKNLIYKKAEKPTNLSYILKKFASFSKDEKSIEEKNGIMCHQNYKFKDIINYDIFSNILDDKNKIKLNDN